MPSLLLQIFVMFYGGEINKMLILTAAQTNGAVGMDRERPELANICYSSGEYVQYNGTNRAQTN